MTIDRINIIWSIYIHYSKLEFYFHMWFISMCHNFITYVLFTDYTEIFFSCGIVTQLLIFSFGFTVKITPSKGTVRKCESTHHATRWKIRYLHNACFPCSQHTFFTFTFGFCNHVFFPIRYLDEKWVGFAVYIFHYYVNGRETCEVVMNVLRMEPIHFKLFKCTYSLKKCNEGGPCIIPFESHWMRYEVWIELSRITYGSWSPERPFRMPFYNLYRFFFWVLFEITHKNL